MTTQFLVGGGKIKKMLVSNDLYSFTNIFLSLILLILLKTLIVKSTYNQIMPVLVRNNGSSTNSFRPLSFNESFTLVIFIMFLF